MDGEARALLSRRKLAHDAARWAYENGKGLKAACASGLFGDPKVVTRNMIERLSPLLRKLKEAPWRLVIMGVACIPFCVRISTNAHMQSCIEVLASVGCLAPCAVWCVQDHHCVIKAHRFWAASFANLITFTSWVLLIAGIVMGKALAPAALSRWRDPPLLLGFVCTISGVVAGFEPWHSFNEKFARACTFAVAHTLRFFVLAWHLQPAHRLSWRALNFMLDPATPSGELFWRGIMTVVVTPTLAGLVGLALRYHMEARTRPKLVETAAKPGLPIQLAPGAPSAVKGTLPKERPRRSVSPGDAAAAVSRAERSIPCPSVVDALELAREYRRDWQDIKFLGHGSFGRVYLIRHAQTQEYAVSKRIPVCAFKERQLLAIKREATALASLPRHPHIIGFRTCFVDGDSFKFVMDLARGGTLAHAIKRQRAGASTDGSSAAPVPFPIATVVRWLSQLLSALMMVHAHGILHRDLKPSNIFLSDTSVRADVKLGDFGLSRSLEACQGDDDDDDTDGGDSGRDNEDDGDGCGLRQCMAHSNVGTPYYMSPEQVLGLPYSYPSDAWSFGCVGFELLTLRRCIKAKNFPDLALKIVDPQQVATYQQELLEAARHRAVDPAPESLITLLSSAGLLLQHSGQRATLADAATCLAPLLGPDDAATRVLLDVEN